MNIMFVVVDDEDDDVVPPLSAMQAFHRKRLRQITQRKNPTTNTNK